MKSLIPLVADHQTRQKGEGTQLSSRPEPVTSSTPGGAMLPNSGARSNDGFSWSACPWKIHSPVVLENSSCACHCPHQKTKISIFSEEINQLLSLRASLLPEYFTHPLRPIQERQAKTKAGIPQLRDRLARLGLCKETGV